MVIYGLEFMVGKYDSVDGARKQAAELVEKAQAASRVDINVEGDLNAESGAMVGMQKGK